MLLTTREEQLVKAFLDYGKLSIHHLSDLLGVSSRTVYRALSDVEVSLNHLGVTLQKAENRYFLEGDISQLTNLVAQKTYTPLERLTLITYHLLLSEQEWRNEDFQKLFGVSNVTVIQDLAEIERRLADFDLTLDRKKGYALRGNGQDLRRFLAILLANSLPVTDFWQGKWGPFEDFLADRLGPAQAVFKTYQKDLPDCDGRLQVFAILLLALSGWGQVVAKTSSVSKLSLDLAQRLYGDLSKSTQTFYNIQEILYYASVLDEVLIKRQETPLFNESFDSEFHYNVSNLIDKVSRYTKINFAKDRVLFGFLFNHIRLNLAVPLVFSEESSRLIAHMALDRNEHLQRVVSLLFQDIFPKYLQSQNEYDLVTLHFASSLRRSPDIYPIRILLLTDDRPLSTELFIARLKTVAPFVEEVAIKATALFQEEDKGRYHCLLATKPVADAGVKLVSSYPEAKELLLLQDYLQEVQANQEIILAEPEVRLVVDASDYLRAAQDLLRTFELVAVPNPKDFAGTVATIVGQREDVSDGAYLTQKLLHRFEVSPLAIPGTKLALLHTQSAQVLSSSFTIAELGQPVKALAMNHQPETVSRVLVMLTRQGEDEAVRELMTAISQSVIENHLYTEIYRTGNREIIYQLLNQIFTQHIKKLET